MKHSTNFFMTMLELSKRQYMYDLWVMDKIFSFKRKDQNIFSKRRDLRTFLKEKFHGKLYKLSFISSCKLFFQKT